MRVDDGICTSDFGLVLEPLDMKEVYTDFPVMYWTIYKVVSYLCLLPNGGITYVVKPSNICFVEATSQTGRNDTFPASR
jgi:hypothetical protein